MLNFVTLPEVIDEVWHCGVHWLRFEQLPEQGLAVLACEGYALLPGVPVKRLFMQNPKTNRQARTAMYAPAGEYYTFWGKYDLEERKNVLLWRPVDLSEGHQPKHWFRVNYLIEPGRIFYQSGRGQGTDCRFDSVELWR